MDKTQTNQLNFEAVAWGALLIWWGITELVDFLPAGVGAIGTGLILLGVNTARARNGIPVSGFSVTIGILALLWGSLELVGVVFSLPFEIPVFAILLIALGVIVLATQRPGSKEQ